MRISLALGLILFLAGCSPSQASQHFQARASAFTVGPIPPPGTPSSLPTTMSITNTGRPISHLIVVYQSFGTWQPTQITGAVHLAGGVFRVGPQSFHASHSTYTWDLGRLAPGARETITMRVAPKSHGPLWFQYTAYGDVRRNGQQSDDPGVVEPAGGRRMTRRPV